MNQGMSQKGKEGRSFVPFPLKQPINSKEGGLTSQLLQGYESRKKKWKKAENEYIDDSENRKRGKEDSLKCFGDKIVKNRRE